MNSWRFLSMLVLVLAGLAGGCRGPDAAVRDTPPEEETWIVELPTEVATVPEVNVHVVFQGEGGNGSILRRLYRIEAGGNIFTGEVPGGMRLFFLASTRDGDSRTFRPYCGEMVIRGPAWYSRSVRPQTSVPAGDKEVEKLSALFLPSAAWCYYAAP